MSVPSELPVATTPATGLTSVQAARRLAVDGPNLLPAPRPPHPLVLLARQMVNFFALMLWVAAVRA
ncbi:MAG: hypothetical protein HGA44_18205, partial [Cellulomonadaceae bacterium]|nr:hypothetical protein [Cellulomonadaceae bacterium]